MKKNILKFIFMFLIIFVSFSIINNINKYNNVYANYSNSYNNEYYYSDNEDEEEDNGGGIFDFIGDSASKLGKTIADFIIDAIINLLVAILTGITKFCAQLCDLVIGDLLKIVLKLETSFEFLNDLRINIFMLSKTLSITLIILMLIKKGSDNYILWQNGNIDENPIELLVRIIFAIVLIIVFDDILKLFNDFVIDIMEQLKNIFNANYSMESLIDSLTNKMKDMDMLYVAGEVFNKSIGAILGSVVSLVVCFNILMSFVAIGKNGIELFILKIGFPLAVVNVIKTDRGQFPQYIMGFIKIYLTVLVQYIIINLSFAFITEATVGNNNGWTALILSIVCSKMVTNTGELLSQFLVASRDGGGGALSRFSGSAGYAAGGKIGKAVVGKYFK